MFNDFNLLSFLFIWMTLYIYIIYIILYFEAEYYTVYFDL